MTDLTLDQEVDAFWAEKPQRAAAPLTARITCRVCDRKEDVPILSSGLLCSLCRQDLDVTTRHIAETLASAELRFQNALDAWNAAYAQADARDQERYHAVEEARAAGVAGFAGKYQRALAKDDGLGALLRAKAACDAATEQVQGRLRVWAEQALLEIESARTGEK